jgi:signal transduction histidine kinase
MLSTLATVPLAASILYTGLLVVALAADYRSRINRTFAIYLLCMILWSFSSFAGRMRFLVNDPLLWAKILAVGCMGLPITFYHFVREFLDLKQHTWRLYLGYALYAVSVLLVLFTHWVLAGARVVGSKYYVDKGPGAYTFVAAWAGMCMLLGIVALGRRYQESSDPDYRSTIRYLLIGVAYLLVGGAAHQVPALQVYPLDIAANVVNALLISYCILRYRLIDITPLLRRTLSYFLLVAIVGGGYALNFLILGRVVALQGWWSLWLASVGVVLAILFFPPLRRAGRSLVDRVLFPQRYDMQRMLQRVSMQASTMIDVTALTRLILDEVTTAMRLQSASIFLRDADTSEFTMVAAKGLDDAVSQMRWRPGHPLLACLDKQPEVQTRAEVDGQCQYLASWSQQSALLDQLGAELFVPVRVKDTLVGVFVVGPQAARTPYTADDKLLLATLANQTAVAVDNARLYATEQRRLKESLVLLDIAATVGSTLDLNQVLKLIAQRTAEACGVYRCSIFLLDGPRQRILPLMSQLASGALDDALWEQFRHRTYVQSIDQVPVLAQLIRDRQPLVIDAAGICLLPESWTTPFGVCSVLLTPLVSRDRVIGAVALDQVEPRKRFGQEQINLAMTIASQVAAAIQNARLYEQLKARAKRLALLGQISMAVTSMLNLDEILQTMVAGLAEVFGVTQCGVVIFDEGGETGRLVAEHPQRANAAGVTIPLRGNLSIERIMVTRHALAIEDAQNDPLLASIRALMRERNVQSMLIVPLLLRGEVVGTIGLDATQERRVFTPEEMELAQTIANQVSVAIENSRLYRQTIEEKAKTEIILQETFSGVVLADDKLRIVSLNPSAESITGYPAQEALGKRLSDVLGAAVMAPGGPLARAIETGEKVPPVETLLPGPQGRKDILLGVTPLSSASGLGSHYLLSFSDISKFKEIDRLKSSIVANVSHELRTPLASIKVYTELLQGAMSEDNLAPYREWLAVIERETDRLTALVNDFLDLSRLESGRFGLTRVPLRLERIIADVVDLLRVQADRRGITIEQTVLPGLVEILADKDLMRIVVKNLLGNALKFSHDGDTIRVRVWQDAQSVRFSVQDEGIGIPSDAIQYLFTKFFRVPAAAATGVQGTGLGLALAREAVGAHGGQIEVESTLGKGSRFTVIIPRDGAS